MLAYVHKTLAQQNDTYRGYMINTLNLKQLGTIIVARPDSCDFNSTHEQGWYLSYQNRGYIQNKDD